MPVIQVVIQKFYPLLIDKRAARNYAFGKGGTMLFLENFASLGIFFLVLVGFVLFTVASSYNLIQWERELVLEKGNNFFEIVLLLRRERAKFEHFQRKSFVVFALSTLSLIVVMAFGTYFDVSIPTNFVYSLILFVLLSLAFDIAFDRVIKFCRTYMPANTS